jgi:HTH-type transcriptional repressor of NAD biosynthesis genes
MTVPISGEIVRKNPLVSWNYLPAPVKGYYAIRIVVVGSESTGKTTLCQQLAEAYNTIWVPEYARSFCEEMLAKKGVSYSDNKDNKESEGESSSATAEGATAGANDEVLYDFKESDFEDFIVKQCMNEEEACRKSPTGVVFCDTNALCTLIWYERYFNKPPPKRLVELKEALMVQPTMYLLMGIEGIFYPSYVNASV